MDGPEPPSRTWERKKDGGSGRMKKKENGEEGSEKLLYSTWVHH
jgi:hypothetical protein